MKNWIKNNLNSKKNIIKPIVTNIDHSEIDYTDLVTEQLIYNISEKLNKLWITHEDWNLNILYSLSYSQWDWVCFNESKTDLNIDEYMKNNCSYSDIDWEDLLKEMKLFLVDNYSLSITRNNHHYNHENSLTFEIENSWSYEFSEYLLDEYKHDDKMTKFIEDNEDTINSNFESSVSDIDSSLVNKLRDILIEAWNEGYKIKEQSQKEDEKVTFFNDFKEINISENFNKNWNDFCLKWFEWAEIVDSIFELSEIDDGKYIHHFWIDRLDKIKIIEKEKNLFYMWKNESQDDYYFIDKELIK